MSAANFKTSTLSAIYDAPVLQSASEPVPNHHAQENSIKLFLTADPSNVLNSSGLTINGVESKSENSGDSIIVLSQRKKWSLLLVFCLGFFIDVWSVSAFFIFTDPISQDLGVPLAQQSWVITSYGVTFGAFLLFWGRISDLYSAKPVFCYGFVVLGCLQLVISFLPDRFSFFVIRAISGIAGACLIPSSYRLITAVFEKDEMGKAFTLFGMSGALANVTGTIAGGVVAYIPGDGQRAAWRWFFRILAIIILPVALGSMKWIPKPKGQIANVDGKWKRLDLVGSFAMLFGIILLVLGLTLGASEGWTSAAFLAPFILSWPLFAFFFVWEHRLPAEQALLPSSTWRIPNFAVLIAFALYIYGWWGCAFLPIIETSLHIHEEPAIVAALRITPQGVAAGLISLVLAKYPSLVARPRWTLSMGMIATFIGYALFLQWDKNQTGSRFWWTLFLGGIIGSAGMQTVFTTVNVAVMTSVNPDMAGVAGAVLQVSCQVGNAVALSVQAGLLTVNEGWLYNFSNVRASWYFELGWGVLWLVMFLVFYRPTKRFAKGQVDGGEKGNGDLPVIAH